jgi:hypothetical protein
MADYEIQIGRIIFVGLLGVILTIDAVMGLQALYYWQLNSTETAEDLYQPPAKLTPLLTAQRTRLADYRMVDPTRGIVSIPIGRAMELVVAELSPDGRTTAAPVGEPQ